MMDPRKRRMRLLMLQTTACALLQFLPVAQAAEPPPILLKVIVDNSLKERYASRAGNWPAFEAELSDAAATELLDKAYWSIFCWPLISSDVEPAGGELHVHLEKRVQPKNWVMNIQFVCNDRKSLIGDFDVFEKDQLGSVREGGIYTGPPPGELGKDIGQWVWTKVLQPGLPSRDKAHTLIRTFVPVGEGEMAPAALMGLLPAECGVVLTDHPLLAGNQCQFKFRPQIPAAPAIPTVGVGTTVALQVGAELVQCIVIRFDPLLQPPPQTKGTVFLNGIADFSADNSLLSP